MCLLTFSLGYLSFKIELFPRLSVFHGVRFYFDVVQSTHRKHLFNLPKSRFALLLFYRAAFPLLRLRVELIVWTTRGGPASGRERRGGRPRLPLSAYLDLEPSWTSLASSSSLFFLWSSTPDATYSGPYTVVYFFNAKKSTAVSVHSVTQLWPSLFVTSDNSFRKQETSASRMASSM